MLRAPAFLKHFLEKGARELAALRKSFSTVDGAGFASDGSISMGYAESKIRG